MEAQGKLLSCPEWSTLASRSLTRTQVAELMLDGEIVLFDVDKVSISCEASYVSSETRP